MKRVIRLAMRLLFLSLVASSFNLAHAQTSDSEEDGAYVELKGYVLGRFSGNNDAYSRVSTSARSTSNIFNQDSNYNFSENSRQFSTKAGVAPKLTLGYVNSNGLGIRTSYFFLQQKVEEQASVPAITVSRTDGPILLEPNPQAIYSARAFDRAQFIAGRTSVVTLSGASFSAATATFRNDFKLHVGDIEITKDVDREDWRYKIAGGARIARSIQRYNGNYSGGVSASDVFGPVSNSESGNLTSENDFTGIGPSALLEVKRNLGGENLKWFGNMRTSLLFGRTKARVKLIETTRFVRTMIISAPPFIRVIPTTSQQTSTSTGNFDDNNVVPVGELETGIEWSNERFFLQGSIVGQSWFGLGTATTKEGNVGLVGGAFAVGVRF